MSIDFPKLSHLAQNVCAIFKYSWMKRFPFHLIRLRQTSKQHQLLTLLLSFCLFFCFPFPETNATKNRLAGVRKTRLHIHRPYQYALVDVSIADTLHADPNDTRVSDLFVVDGQRGLRGAAGRWRLRVQDQRRGAEVRMRGAAGGAGKTGRGGHGAGVEILCNIVKGAWERLREEERGKDRGIYEYYVTIPNQSAQFLKQLSRKSLCVFKLGPCWPLCTLTINTRDCQCPYLEFESQGGKLRDGEVLHVWTAGSRRHTDLVSVGLPQGAVTGCSQPAHTNTIKLCTFSWNCDWNPLFKSLN